MKAAFFCLAALPVVLGDLLQPRACIADNCARAVTGTVAGKTPDITSRQADCSSFMRTTVTPAPVVTTITNTFRGWQGPSGFQGPLKKRGLPDLLGLPVLPVLAPRQQTVVPSDVPAYASWCSGTARYSSACSCWGITATATTAPAATVTEYATAWRPCLGGTCGQWQGATCDQVGEQCYCAISADGESVCVGWPGSCNMHCGPNNSCAEGYVCVPDSCCDVPECLPVAVGTRCQDSFFGWNV